MKKRVGFASDCVNEDVLHDAESLFLHEESLEDAEMVVFLCYVVVSEEEVCYMVYVQRVDGEVVLHEVQ